MNYRGSILGCPECSINSQLSMHLVLSLSPHKKFRIDANPALDFINHTAKLHMLSKRSLGTQGLNVSSIGLGLMGMSQSYGAPEERDERESIATIRRAIELGCTFLDTAEVYGPYVNEELLARALKEIGVARESVTIATKFGFRFENGTIAGIDSSPGNVRKAVEGSLRRLDTEYIDLYYQHRVDKAVPIEDTVGAMADLVREGKVRYLGLSEAGEKTI